MIWHHSTFNRSFLHILQLHIYMAWFSPLHLLQPPLLPLPSPLLPLPSPLYSLSLTWRPPAVTGTVLPLIRLLVDWPHLPHPSPDYPTHSNSQNPNSPTPDNDDIGTTPLWLCGTLPPVFCTCTVLSYCSIIRWCFSFSCNSLSLLRTNSLPYLRKMLLTLSFSYNLMHYQLGNRSI